MLITFVELFIFPLTPGYEFLYSYLTSFCLFEVLGIEYKALCRLRTCSTTELCVQASIPNNFKKENSLLKSALIPHFNHTGFSLIW